MKETILLSIFNAFEKWSASIPKACVKGCSACCTQNVTITALEGERILDFIRKEGLESWFAERLQMARPTATPLLTTNEYAEACLKGIETDDSDDHEKLAPCPFLNRNCCTIYPVRPFGCRCFASERVCRPGETAILPDSYVAASTAVMQIIEHLGQQEYWGNMLDVLLALCDILSNKKITAFLPNQTMIIQARLRTRRARPLPGFLLLEEEQEKIAPLLNAIFSTRIEGITINDILNGRERTPRLNNEK
jgi:Fe-S-cluster containining protein